MEVVAEALVLGDGRRATPTTGASASASMRRGNDAQRDERGEHGADREAHRRGAERALVAEDLLARCAPR